MTTQLQTLTADMASVKTLLQTQCDSNLKILKILEGNGMPGLVQKVAMTEAVVNEMKCDQGKLTEEVTRVNKLVETVNETVRLHTQEGNPQHDTLARAFREKPFQVIASSIFVVLVLTAGIVSGYFQHVVTYFASMAHP